MNTQKSKVAKIKDVTFLGCQILKGKIRISDKARGTFKKRIRDLTPRKDLHTIYQLIKEFNEYLRGWTKMDRWKSVNRREVRFTLDLKWFRKLGLFFLHDYTLVLSQS